MNPENKKEGKPMTSNEMEMAKKILLGRGFGITQDTNYHIDLNWRDVELLQEAIATVLSTHGEERFREGLLRGAEVLREAYANNDLLSISDLAELIELEAKGKKGVE